VTEKLAEAAPEENKESADSTLLAAQDEEEKRKAEAGAEAAQRPAESYLVFSGGRGDAKEQDFGRSEPVEYNRVRP
jgi:hypothetical protein